MNTTFCISLTDADRHRLFAIANEWRVNETDAIRRLIREERERETTKPA